MQQTVLTAFLLAALPLAAAPVKIHGYVTCVTSPASFEIDDYHITRADSLGFEVDKGEYPDTTFQPEDLRVGTELEVQGDLNDSTHEVQATAITVFVSDNLRVKRSTVIEHASTLEREGNGFRGVIRADGETIKVDPQTRLSLKEGQTNQIAPGLSITYEGRRERDGSITASKLAIFHDSRGEQKLSQDLTPKLNSSGQLSIHGVKYKLAPDAEAQGYVQRIGAALVPSFYQQDLSNGAARQIPFQFFLVENPNFNAHAFPNGTVLINTGVFRVLSSEAQFAAVLGHEIAHATQQHSFVDMHYQRKAGTLKKSGRNDDAKGEMNTNSYSRILENQADRLSLEYMVAGGYDPREAAEVWKQVAHEGIQGSKWSGQEDGIARRSYLLAELRMNYSAVDFRSYVKDREQFDALAERFGNTSITQRAADPAPVAIASSGSAPAQPVIAQAPRRSGLIRPQPEPVVAQPVRTANGPAESPGKNHSTSGVTITSEPAGADVAVNGTIVGKTPLLLPTGNVGIPFVVTVRKAGYFVWTGQLVTTPGQTNLRVDLRPAH